MNDPGADGGPGQYAPARTGGAAAHARAVDVRLTPVLVEIGASCPARGLSLYGPQIDEPAEPIDAWFALAGRALGRALT
mgnify:CR=1 FL=1